jgi:hypothetical protein
LFIILVINIQIKVDGKASKRLRTVCSFFEFIAPASILSETANETMKTISGSKKARMTLSATEGPGELPSLS